MSRGPRLANKLYIDENDYKGLRNMLIKGHFLTVVKMYNVMTYEISV